MYFSSLSFLVFFASVIAYTASEEKHDCLNWAMKRLKGEGCPPANGTGDGATRTENYKGGPQGPPGPQGPQGLPGTCECDEKQLSSLEMQNSELTKDITNLKSEVDDLSAKIDQISQDKDVQIQQLEDKLTSFSKSLFKMQGWMMVDDKYYYKLFTTKVNYKTAQSKCKEAGGRLASTGMRDSTIRRAVFDKLVAPMKTFVWIGLDDIARESRWVWSDGVISDRGNTNWQHGQPDNYGGLEDCGHFHSLIRGKINDRPCNLENPFLCEIVSDM